MRGKGLFDHRVDEYDQWFRTPIGRLVRAYEQAAVLDFLKPSEGETILDAGCGSGVFTTSILAPGTTVVGVDISLPMLTRAGEKVENARFFRVVGDMTALPFEACIFDKAVSITALEFIRDGAGALAELFRVTKTGGSVVVATLNSLSPWAMQRKRDAAEGKNPLFKEVCFRSPEDMRALTPAACLIKTVIHFQKEDAPALAQSRENQGQSEGLPTGAFLIARWEKP